MQKDLIRKFCSPPKMEITGFDEKSVATAELKLIDFGEIQIPLYMWGEGQTVLLIHGWGSRASHMTLFQRELVNAGYKVIAFDAPAHSSRNDFNTIELSNMFIFGNAIARVAEEIGEIHTVVGHSFGGFTTPFVNLGYKRFADKSIHYKNMVFISSPARFSTILDSYVVNNNTTPEERTFLYSGLEEEYDFRISDYDMRQLIPNNGINTLIIHDEDDEDIPIAEAKELSEIFPGSEYYFTKGFGHKKILFNRSAAKRVTEFLKDK